LVKTPHTHQLLHPPSANPNRALYIK
jgi:hypothetical protein